jgi:hypothetical protein
MSLSKVSIGALALFISAFVSGCAYDGSIRYPCQEFKNWEKPECTPPQCEATGVCTKDLLPPEVFEENQ